MKISECKGKIQVGDKVLVSTSNRIYSGIIRIITDDGFDFETDICVCHSNFNSNESVEILRTSQERGGGWPGFNGWSEFSSTNGKFNLNNKTFMSDTLEKFKKLFQAEPLKTFVKAGIKEDDGELTQDGESIVLELMAKKFETELKEIADKMLAEE
jgi:hypothetical protein